MAHVEEMDYHICTHINQYASQCKEDDICEEWRQNTTLACMQPTCAKNSHYEECGRGCEKTCEQNECNGQLSAGCYCDEGMVNWISIIILIN